MLPVPRSLHEEVDREAARVASRLRTLTPRRLPVALVVPAVQRLADLAADAEGVPRRPVPDLAAHGWADLLRVLIGDLHAAPGVAEPQLATARDLLVALRRTLP